MPNFEEYDEIKEIHGQDQTVVKKDAEYVKGEGYTADKYETDAERAVNRLLAQGWKLLDIKQFNWATYACNLEGPVYILGRKHGKE